MVSRPISWLGSLHFADPVSASRLSSSVTHIASEPGACSASAYQLLPLCVATTAPVAPATLRKSRRVGVFAMLRLQLLAGLIEATASECESEANLTWMVLISYGLVWTVTTSCASGRLPAGCSIRFVSDTAAAPGRRCRAPSVSFPAHS